MKLIIATLKSWNIENALLFKNKYAKVHQIKVIENREDLSIAVLNDFKPDYIFFPHWSYIIPKEIYEGFECIVFHMTDLPYGRGGSPLQNLIIRGFKQTKISAIRVEKEIDAGPVYLKKEVSLEGSADEIYRRISNLIFEELIPQIIENAFQPADQVGDPVYFERRIPGESEMMNTFLPEQIYDYIRMLDAEGYPKAFLRWGDYKLVFSGGSYDGETIKANVEIVKEQT